MLFPEGPVASDPLGRVFEVMRDLCVLPFAVNGDTYVTDQGIRPDTTLEALAKLKPGSAKGTYMKSITISTTLELIKRLFNSVKREVEAGAC